MNRRRLLQWSGLSSLGLFVPGLTPIRTTIATKRNYFRYLTLKQPSITVDHAGSAIASQPVSVHGFVEHLGHGIHFTMVKIPAGTMVIGSPKTEKGRFEHESLPYLINLPTFFMGMTPITQSVYAAVMGQNPVANYNPMFLHPNKPVVGVTAASAIAFCQALSHRTGTTYRLPTETEWEYACRAGTTAPFHCGDTLTSDLANYCSEVTYGIEPRNTHQYHITPVGQFPPNPFGLFDMHGNVWEWCMKSSPSPRPDHSVAQPDENGSTPLWELRGGSWQSYPSICRSATSLRHAADTGLATFGLRIVCPP